MGVAFGNLSLFDDILSAENLRLSSLADQSAELLMDIGCVCATLCGLDQSSGSVDVLLVVADRCRCADPPVDE